jgi:hypothetical protein
VARGRQRHLHPAVFITQQTARYGLGNRPGRYDFNSGPQWPYGKRTGVFPVWAHRQPNTYPIVRYQLGDLDGNGKPLHDCCDTENDLSHSRSISSQEMHYCPPEPAGSQQVDTVTCASLAFTDKGEFDTTHCGSDSDCTAGFCSSSQCTSLYPPRADLVIGDQANAPSVAQYAALNPFDAVTSATPAGNTPYEIAFPIPKALANGNYVIWLEVSKEFDQNAFYGSCPTTSTMNPDDCAQHGCTARSLGSGSNGMYAYACDASPMVPYGDYGAAYRGQPSIVFNAPFVLSGSDTSATTLDYVGYGDIDGATGTLHPPDATISSNVSGSGPNRLQVVSDGTGMYRVKVLSHPEIVNVPPFAPTQIAATMPTATGTVVSFDEPANPGSGAGPVASYQIRVLAGGTITDANFGSAMPVSASVIPTGFSAPQTFQLTGLLPQTNYSVGIRAIDDCGNVGPVGAASFTTAERLGGEVDACFIATAAYGSLMANDVEVLREFRDMALRKSVLGELLVEGYYTFGPPVAGVVGESELLRASARDALAPIVKQVRALESARR